ncbi:MAG: arginine N-succinyltransferase [Pseudomonadales bacterium]|nr:arginine N-succinyltransferase [Pseudomonadales bacterium]NRA14442.1 arginine N-succinyltransferase [Oceanospirillaceae bacterium]
MMVIRPIESRDGEALAELAKITGPGFTSLQDNSEVVSNKLTTALAAFEQQDKRGEALYLFVLEDLEEQRIAGICAIEAAVGLSDPWYNYRIGTLVHASKELNVYNQMQTLTISNDHTGYSELCTLFLHPDYRHSKNGHLLSKCRFMFMAEFPQLFHEKLVAEMRGYSDKDGISPFWEGLGKHFFSIDFTTADKMSSIDKAFIAELMPKYTLYTNLLPESARDVIAQTHENTIPARKLLEREGMRYTGYIDIFDAGPTLEANVDDIRAIKDSRYAKVKITDQPTTGELYLVSNTKFENFRCTMVAIGEMGNNLITMQTETAQALGVSAGSTVRIVPLVAQKR